eukprot:Awhi_evm1s4274
MSGKFSKTAAIKLDPFSDKPNEDENEDEDDDDDDDDNDDDKDGDDDDDDDCEDGIVAAAVVDSVSGIA